MSFYEIRHASGGWIARVYYDPRNLPQARKAAQAIVDTYVSLKWLTRNMLTNVILVHEGE